MNRRIYLDHNASTPVHPEVLQAMLPYFSEHFGNPSSVHAFGRDARDGMETARERIAGFLKVSKDEVVGLLVEQVDGRAGQHDVEGSFARDDAERDAHGLVRAMRDTGIFRDQDQDRLPGGHAS